MNRKCGKFLCFVLALALLLAGCGKEAESRDALRLWYQEGAPLAAGLDQLAADYNRQKAKNQPPLQLRAFPDEESLLAALGVNPPELLLCPHTLAFSLYDSGALEDARLSADYDDALLARSEAVGRGFYPLGSQVTLLYGRGEALESIASLEDLLDTAAGYGSPFFTAETFAPLLYQLMLSRGSEFHALRDRDLKNEHYTAVYNRFAEAALAGGLIVREDGPALVQSGALPCVAAASTSLPGAGADGMVFLPLPGSIPEEALLARCWGLAVTARPGRAAPFLAWLLAGDRSGSLALDAGLIPALPGELAAAEGLSALLLTLARNAALHLPDGDSDFVRNCAGFEAAFRAALRVFD